MTYFTPSTPKPSDPVAVALEAAKRELKDNPRSDVHTVYRGLKHVAGSETPVECVVCVVSRKSNFSVAQGLPAVPRTYSVNGCEVLTDVVEGEPPAIARLPIGNVSVFAANDHQKCFNCPVPGGVQIAPQGAQWVGTLGSAIRLGEVFGAVTNYHVAHGGEFPVGAKIAQPASGADWIATLAKWCPIRFDDQPNYIDAAVLDCHRTDGKFSPLTHTVFPSQYGIGAFNPEPYTDLKIGDRVIKSGRTTGVTGGKVIGLEASTSVDYSPEGVAKFDRQIYIRSDRGYFSKAGDSGSLIFHEATKRPCGLLFAGGGRETIANPIGFVVEWLQKTFGTAGFFQA